MPGGLDDYRKKRDFSRTPEPAPRADGVGAGRFVVHRHEARNLHYDLRIETGDALASWAVPKGFSYDPKIKRLAVRTEDHPLEYLAFEGVIPKGEYGAGTMKVWDSGTFDDLPAKDGERKLVLRGRKLRGEWHLVRTKGGAERQEHWLLFKSRDVYAGADRDTALGVDVTPARAGNPPGRMTPMRPSVDAAPFVDARWLFEMEFAGKRLFAEKVGGDVRLRGVRRKFPVIESDLERLACDRALLDGVLVVQAGSGRPSQERLDAALSGGSTEGLVYYAFDLLFWEEFDLRHLPLVDRKRALRSVLPTELGHVLYTDHVAGEGERLASVVAAAGLPGMLAKRAGSPYRAGKSDDWKRVAVSREGGPPDELGRALARPKTGATRVKRSNSNKVYFPQIGVTKGELLAYYESVAEYLVPHLAERPCHMLRYPDGVEGKSFYQHRAPEGVPDWVEVEEIANDKGEIAPYVIVNDVDTLLYVVNLGSIDLHPWLSRRATPDSPDWAVIDLDPKDASFADVIRVAREIGRLLRGIGMRPLLKTSGKTGLHVYVPLAPGYSYDQARMFAEAVARLVAREHKSIATVERQLADREGKVYVDYLQIGKGLTVVAPYVVRPVPEATVSTPLEWDELEDALDPRAFTLHDVPARVARLGDLFRAVLEDGHELGPAIAALTEQMG